VRGVGCGVFWGIRGGCGVWYVYCMYTVLYVSSYIHMYMYIWIDIDTCVCTQLCVCSCYFQGFDSDVLGLFVGGVYVHTYLVCIYTFICMYIYVYFYMYICTHIRVCVYIYTYGYIQTSHLSSESTQLSHLTSTNPRQCRVLLIASRSLLIRCRALWIECNAGGGSVWRGSNVRCRVLEIACSYPRLLLSSSNVVNAHQHRVCVCVRAYVYVCAPFTYVFIYMRIHMNVCIYM